MLLKLEQGVRLTLGRLFLSPQVEVEAIALSYVGALVTRGPTVFHHPSRSNSEAVPPG